MIHFMGGEPYGLQTFSVIITSIDETTPFDTSKTITLYNTNGTFRPKEEQIKIWENL